MKCELVSNMFFDLAEIILNVFCVFFSLAHQATQTPVACSPAAKTTSLGLADLCKFRPVNVVHVCI